MNTMSSDSSRSPGEIDHAAFAAKLQSLEPTSRRTVKTFSLKDYVRQHYEGLQDAHQKGYAWSALAELIKAELDLSIAPETLRKYMATIRKERKQSKNPDKIISQPQPPRPKFSHRKEQNLPLSQNLQLSADQEFRPRPRRNE